MGILIGARASTVAVQIRRLLMFRVAAVACDVLLATASGAPAAPVNPVTASGYIEASRGRPFLKGALDKANSVLAASSSYRLLGSWEKVPSNVGPSDVVRVHLIEATRSPFVLQVPFRSCRCIFLQEAAFRRSLVRYSTCLRQMIRLEEDLMLAFMLLHEVGHVSSGDPGRHNAEGTAYNLEDTEQKRRERAADEFAAKALKVAEERTYEVAGFLAAMGIQRTIAKASWNLTALRLLDNFGGSALCRNQLSADSGASHPNYELRVLTVNDIIAGTPTSHELVAAFEACRRPGGIAAGER